MHAHGNILVFAAHSDDQVLGAGGTISRYSEKGHKVTVVVFSFGEMTHPWLLRKFSASMRVKESQKAARILGCEKTLFLGLPEGRFAEQEGQIRDRIREIITSVAPSRIFLHAQGDLHPDHRAVYKIVRDVLRDFSIPAYTYDIWNPLQSNSSQSPELYVDISETFHKKIRALSKYRSQRIAIGVLIFGVYLRAIMNGIHHDCLFAERFVKLK